MKIMKFGENLELSQVIVGCMRMKDAGLYGDALLSFVESCLDMGITTFDHAPVYGHFECEKLFGDAVLKKKPKLRDQMKLVTKAGIVLPGTQGNKVIYYRSTKEALLKEIDASLQRLGTDYVDLLLIHRPDPLADPKQTAEALEEIVQTKKALNVGVSNFMPSQVTMLQSYMSVPLVTNQVELSLKNTEHFFNGTVDDAHTRRMRLMAWSPLGGGSIFQGQDAQARRIRETAEEIAKAHGAALDEVMYAWLYAHPVGISVITGSMNLERIQAAVKALDLKLSYDEWYQLLAASRGYQVP